MLDETFIFLPGVQEKTERKLWEAGVSTWDELLAAENIQGISKARLNFWKNRLRNSGNLPRLGRYVWRAYDTIMENPRFLDIETNEYNQITVCGVSDGEFYQAFTRGMNLDAVSLRKAFAEATCLVTFNGSSFDLPMIERAFPGVLPDVPHLDLRHICGQAGLRGGLKRIEQHLNISRAAAIRDNDGVDAILLWREYTLGDKEALRELIDYNAADVLNLAPLADMVIRALWKHVRYGEILPFGSVIGVTSNPYS